MSRELQKAQRKLTKRATNLANEWARAELLAPGAPLVKKLSSATGRHIEWLRKEWSPFDPDYESPTGIGMKLTIGKDKLIRQLLIEEGAYQVLEEIALEAVVQTMSSTTAQPDSSNNAKDFFGALINDLLFQEKPFYHADTHR